MRAVIQRVLEAKVVVNNKIISKIGKGLLVFICFEKEDKKEFMDKFVDKIINLRIFEDNQGKMNLSLKDIDGEILIVSQFTLAADCKKGRRPFFGNAMDIKEAKKWFEEFIEKVKKSYKQDKVFSGEFQADMKVHLINDGPVTIILDSKEIC